MYVPVSTDNALYRDSGYISVINQKVIVRAQYWDLITQETILHLHYIYICVCATIAPVQKVADTSHDYIHL